MSNIFFYIEQMLQPLQEDFLIEHIADFVGQEITLHGFYQDDTIVGTLESLSFDHMKLRVTEGEYAGVLLNIDLHVKGNGNPKIQSISCNGNTISFYEDGYMPKRKVILQAEAEIKKQAIQLIRMHEAGVLKIAELDEELLSMGIDDTILKKIKTVNYTVMTTLLLRRNNAS